MFTLQHFFLLMALGFFLTPNVGHSEELPRARPYRPTLSNPAQLPIPGYLEVETGWQTLKDKATDDYQHSIPYLFKFGFSDYVGLLVGGDGLIINDIDQGTSLAGLGNIMPLLKLHIPLSTHGESALGVEMGATLPTAPQTISSQKTDYLITGLYSIAMGAISIDLNARIPV